MRSPPTRIAHVLLFVATVFSLSTTIVHSFPFFDPEERPGSTLNDRKEPEKWLFDATKDWMSQLPDTTDLRVMSIPGTHDTAADIGGAYCETQSWSLPTQLDAGIRYLDIRARRNGNKFTIHHGLCFLHMSYDDVMRDVSAFLKHHPSETIIMRVKEEWRAADGSEPFRDIWAHYYAQSPRLYVAGTNGRVPKLGEVRGKVLVLRNADFGDKKVGLRYDGQLTSVQDFYRVFFSFRNMPFGEDTVSVGQKARKVVEFLKKTLAGTSLFLNHFSGAVGMFPKDVARLTNKAGYDAIGRYEKRKTTGIVIMDYPGEWLIYRVIQTNFSPTSTEAEDAPQSDTKCAERTWRVESDMTFAEISIPESNAGRQIFVQPGAHGTFQLPAFHRVKWSSLEFICRQDGGWKMIGSMDADGRCCSYNTSQPFLNVGSRSFLRRWMWAWEPIKRVISIVW